MTTGLKIRQAYYADLKSVVAIEAKSSDHPWSQDDFQRCDRQRNCSSMVAEVNGRIVGFIVYEMLRSSLRILNLAVHPEARCNGIGKAMVDRLIDRLSEDQRQRILIDVRESSLDAQLFFKRLGFTAVSVVRGFFGDTKEDSYVMQFRFTTQLPVSCERFVVSHQYPTF